MFNSNFQFIRCERARVNTLAKSARLRSSPRALALWAMIALGALPAAVSCCWAAVQQTTVAVDPRQSQPAASHLASLRPGDF